MPKKSQKQGDRLVDLPVSLSGQITLLTDFGTSDYFVGAVKGVILSLNPTAKIIDITHDISPQDIQAAAFTLLACYRSFALGTIHVVVVDPGVGSTRRPILVQAGGYYFVGPDNGVFSYILDNEKHARVFQITKKKFFQQPMSNTFHGRDVFAPVAAALSNGVTPENFGREIFDALRLGTLKVKASRSGMLKAQIIHVDRFGNCVTNVDGSALSESQAKRATLVVKGKRIGSIRKSYAESGPANEPFAIWGSAGFLEISVRNGSAGQVLQVERGESVVVEIETN
jgi:S-adenosyl-L-methionine hydrolase (adenosine-forming)